MKSQNLESLRPTFPFPIAGNDASSTTIPESSGNLNREYGFKSSYFGNNALVTKNDFNGVLKSITSNLAYGNAGGFYEFDPSVAQAIGGYAKDAVLVYMEGGVMHLVRSVHDNNLVNFNEVGVNGIDWELALPNDDFRQRLLPDINWNARNAELLFRIDNNVKNPFSSMGTFTSKGYVVPVENNVVYNTTGSTYAYAFHIYLIVSAIGGPDLTDIDPDDIIGNPLSSSVKAFPINLIDGVNAPSSSFAFINQAQVQKGTNYKISSDRSGYAIISSGSVDIYFIPTPD